MASPFPGMDPYLEDSHIWPGFHHSLAEEIRAQLNARIGPKYYADVNVRTVLLEGVTIAIPRTMYSDVGVLEPASQEPVPGPAVAAITIAPAPVQRLVVMDQTRLRTVRVYVTETDELVTSIEILSPYNKRPGEGLGEYRRKRSQLLRSPVHLVEIDLLRAGESPGREVSEPPLDADYVLLVNRHHPGDARRISEIWPVALNEPLPLLPVPLLTPDPDVALDLNAAIRSVYARAGYEWRIDYRRPVPPPELRPGMATWLKQHLNVERP